jgi:hypothetical protein
MLFDWFVIGQVVPHNPAASVRGPKHVVSRGKTPVLPREGSRELIDTIETDTLIGLHHPCRPRCRSRCVSASGRPGSRPSTWWNLLVSCEWPRLRLAWVAVAGFRWSARG